MTVSGAGREGERDMSVQDLLTGEVRVINVGLEWFAEMLEGLGVPVLQVDWRPPAGGDPRLAGLLAKLAALDSKD
jgi:FdrA protein